MRARTPSMDHAAGSRCSPTCRISRWTCGWGRRSEHRRAALRSRWASHGQVDHQRGVGEASPLTVDEQVGLGRERRRERTRGAARWSSGPRPPHPRGAPSVRRRRRSRRTYTNRPGLSSSRMPSVERRCRRRGALERHRPRARARLRRARPDLRRRDRRRHGERHLHPDDARLPDRPAGLRADARSSSASSTGVDEVTPSMVFTPPWSPDKMSEDAKFALGY